MSLFSGFDVTLPEVAFFPRLPARLPRVDQCQPDGVSSRRRSSGCPRSTGIKLISTSRFKATPLDNTALIQLGIAQAGIDTTRFTHKKDMT